MFTIFEKQEVEALVKVHTGAFQSEFSDIQKRAILASLFLIANADGVYDKAEKQFFDKIERFLNCKYLGIASYVSIKEEELYPVLKNLSQTQKEWYMVTLFGMLHADGVALEVEINFSNVFLEAMGIDQVAFEKVLKEHKLIEAYFA